MRSNGSRSSKSSKDAQAERILESLLIKSKSSLAPKSRKIRKKRSSNQTTRPSFSLTFRTCQNRSRVLEWILPEAPIKKKTRRTRVILRKTAHVPTQTKVLRKKAIPKNKEPEPVNYAVLFETAYQEFMTESSASGSRRVHTTENVPKKAFLARQKQTFSAIEYDPKDNHFYLVSESGHVKKPLFENKGFALSSQPPAFLLPPNFLHNLKNDFALHSLLS